jgi:hypothetical protein
MKMSDSSEVPIGVWVSVKEGLPPDGMVVLTVDVNGYVSTCEINKGLWRYVACYFDPNCCNCKCIAPVKYWSYLPEVPDELD